MADIVVLLDPYKPTIATPRADNIVFYHLHPLSCTIAYTSGPGSSIAPAPGIIIPLDQPVERVELVVLGDGS